MADNFPYPKGSEWRKWDLHVHTNYSYDYELSCDDCIDKIVESINSCEASALAITDHYVLDGYLKLLDKKQDIKKVLFPGIELRLEDSILPSRDGKTASTTDRPIHVQIIFSNEDKDLVKIKEFINSLQFKDFSDHSNDLTRTNIINLGKKIDPRLDEVNAFKKGCEVIRIPKAEIETKLKQKGLKDRSLIILPYEKYGGIDHIDPINDPLIKTHLTKLADIIESSKADQISFFNGNSEKMPLNKNGIVNADFVTYIGKTKPCINGSDSHHPDKIGVFPNKKTCWIKSDLTFEGLKQITYEPERRVYIGEEPPYKKDKSKIIKSIKIENSNNWFSNSNYIFNEEQVSIIGCKGSGKTALLDLIAYAAGSFDFANDSSFLKRANKELIGASIELIWMDEKKDKIEIDKLNKENYNEMQKVRYLTQSFVEKLCEFDKARILTEEIENVIFQNLQKEDKQNFNNFKNYKQAQLQVIKLNQSKLTNQLMQINNEIIENSNKLKNEKSTKNQLKELNEELLVFEKEYINLTKAHDIKNRAKLEEFKLKNSEKSDKENKISNLNTIILEIDKIENNIKQFVSDKNTFLIELKNNLKLLEIDDVYIENIQVSLLPENLLEVLDQKKRKVIASINKFQNELTELKALIDRITNELNLEKSREDQLKKISESIENKKSRIEFIKKQLTEINLVKDQLPHKIENRKKMIIEYFSLLFEEKLKLSKIYSPISRNVKSNDRETTNLFQFTVNFSFDYKKMGEKGENFIDHHKLGRFFQKHERALEEELIKNKLELVIPEIDLNNYDLNSVKEQFIVLNAEIITKYLNAVEELFTKNDRNAIKIEDQLKKNYNENDFYNWLYSTEFYKTVDSLKFNNTDLDKLSPGLKGISLLILFLELDQEDQRPLLIDQPEENLDNRSVYETLRKYFLSVKKRRQVFLITHNPNLVVNTDSEQIFVANYDASQQKQPTNIYYVSGSIENDKGFMNNRIKLSEKGIRQHICQILEGGEEAFEKREQKYGFK